MQKSKAFAAYLFMGLFLVSYQNCSQVQFDSNGMAIGVEGAPDLPRQNPDDSQRVEKIGNESAANCRDVLDSLNDAVGVVDGASIEGIRGHAFFNGNKISRLDNNQGAIKIGSLAADAKIDLINNEAGLLYICNMDVAKIENSNGRIIVVGGNVGDVSNFSGQLDVIGGKIIGSVNGNNGVIKQN